MTVRLGASGGGPGGDRRNDWVLWGEAPGVTRRNNSGEVPAGHPRGLPAGAGLRFGRCSGAVRIGAATGLLAIGVGGLRRIVAGGGRVGVVALAGLLFGVGVVGCGGGDAAGATVSVYVAAPLCAGAKAALGSHGARAGHFTVAVRCLAPSERAGGGVDLATDGSNSRRATSDSSAVATLEPPGPGTKFTRAILESAEIPLVTSASARKGMNRIISAVEGAGDSDVRNSVREALEPA